MNKNTKLLFLLSCLFLSTNVFCSMDNVSFSQRFRSFFDRTAKNKSDVKTNRFNPYSACSKYQISLMSKPAKLTTSDSYRRKIRHICYKLCFFDMKKHKCKPIRDRSSCLNRLAITRKIKFPFISKVLRSTRLRNVNVFWGSSFFPDRSGVFLEDCFQSMKRFISQLSVFKKSILIQVQSTKNYNVPMPFNKLKSFCFENCTEIESVFLQRCSDRLLSKISFDSLVWLYGKIKAIRIVGVVNDVFEKFYRLIEKKFSDRREQEYLFSKKYFSKIKVLIDSPCYPSNSKKYSLIGLYALHYLKFYYGRNNFLLEEFFRENPFEPKHISSYSDYYFFLNTIAWFIVKRYEKVKLQSLRQELYNQLHDIFNDIKKFQSNSYPRPTNIYNDMNNYIKKLETIVLNEEPKETALKKEIAPKKSISPCPTTIDNDVNNIKKFEAIVLNEEPKETAPKKETKPKKSISPFARNMVANVLLISVASFFFYYTFSPTLKNFFLSFSK